MMQEKTQSFWRELGLIYSKGDLCVLRDLYSSSALFFCNAFYGNFKY